MSNKYLLGENYITFAFCGHYGLKQPQAASKSASTASEHSLRWQWY